ncbi:MAG: site-specific integrase [Acidimicrobiia bacterium]
MIRRHGNRWQVTVYAGADPDTGRERRVRASVRALPGQKRPSKEARELEARLLLEVGAGEHRDIRITVAELLDRWMEHAAPDLSPHTAHGYRLYIARNIVPAIGRVRVDKLTTAMLDRLYRQLRESGGKGGRPLAPATVRQVHAVIRRALVQAQRWGWIKDNPAALATPPKIVRREMVPPTPAQVARILAEAEADGAPTALAIRLAALTGARRGEVCGIRWSDIDLDAASLVIRRSIVELDHRLTAKDPKTHQVRRVSLDDETLAMLRSRRTAQAELALAIGVALVDEAYVCSEHPAGTEPLHPSMLSERFRRIARRLKVQARLHDLRHWHVTQALGAGLPVRDVAERVGHASARMTLDVYGHAIAGADRKAAEAVAAILDEVAVDTKPTKLRRRPRRPTFGT